MNYFLTGTDTGVGKTLIGSALLFSLRRDSDAARRFQPIKPVACGGLAGRLNGSPIQDDALLLNAATGMAYPCGDVNPVFLNAPAAPTVAARRQHTSVDLAAVDRLLNAINADGRIALVEGAGGLLVPLTETLSFAYWAAARGLTLILVARAGLGTINHKIGRASCRERV